MLSCWYVELSFVWPFVSSSHDCYKQTGELVLPFPVWLRDMAVIVVGTLVCGVGLQSSWLQGLAWLAMRYGFKCCRCSSECCCAPGAGVLGEGL